MRNTLTSHCLQQLLGKYLVGEKDAFKVFLSFLSTQALTFISVLGHEHSSVYSFSTFNITELYFTV